MNIDTNGAILAEREDTIEDDLIQRMVTAYCDDWLQLKKCERHHMGLPLAKILRNCADEIEQKLK